MLWFVSVSESYCNRFVFSEWLGELKPKNIYMQNSIKNYLVFSEGSPAYSDLILG